MLNYCVPNNIICVVNSTGLARRIGVRCFRTEHRRTIEYDTAVRYCRRSSRTSLQVPRYKYHVQNRVTSRSSEFWCSAAYIIAYNNIMYNAIRCELRFFPKNFQSTTPLRIINVFAIMIYTLIIIVTGTLHRLW